MKNYLNKGGKSSVKYYEIAEERITIIFNNSSESYTWSYRSAGSYHVERMKKLDDNGIGLNSYILTNVKYNFERK
jgi:hypothetical protein